MTSIERLAVAALMTLSAGAGATGAIYLRPLQSPKQTAIAVPGQPALPKPHAVRTVSWFKAHADEIHQEIVACRDNSGMGNNDPECANASDAAEDLAFEKHHEEGKRRGILP
jgi:hypothetical protein